MSLPIYEKGERKEVHIKQGQMFLLPGRIPHSPQRPEDGSLGFEKKKHTSNQKNTKKKMRNFDSRQGTKHPKQKKTNK